MSEEGLKRLYKEADAFLNVTGAQELRMEHIECRRRIYVESDPFSTQARVAQGDQKSIAMLEGHDTLFSFGENIGAPDCGVPVGESRWYQTRQPVAVDLWRSNHRAEPDTYRTITTWHNKVKDVVYNGEKYYWTKDREFERFLDLPQKRSLNFELATSVPKQVCDRLTEKGWKLADSVHISQDLTRYSNYIQSARAEFTVARDQYVRPRTGWFSDRTACFLAAGRPVITQETGFSKFLPTGKGLFGFESMDDILGAVDEIESDYEGNCRAASEIADEYFAAEKVLASLMQRAGL